MALATDPTNTDAVISSWEKYAAANDVAKFAPDMVSDLLLPGHAFGPRASCGQYRLIGCLDDSHKNIIKKIKWSCHSRNCRVCWRNWAQQRARVVSDRLVAGVAHLAGPHVAKAQGPQGPARGGVGPPRLQGSVHHHVRQEGFTPAGQGEIAAGG